MKLSRRVLWLLPVVLAASRADAQPSSVETALKPIIDKLARTASSQQFSQIIGAVRASPQLARQLGRLAEQRKLTEIRIVAARGTGKPFSAWVDGTTMAFTADFLKAQADYRGPSFHAGDILPNNTVYCLGHLAYHLAMGTPDPAKFSRMDEFLRKNLEIEAGAYIQGYNDAMDAALQQNGGKPLSERQVLPFLMNPWYREALGKVRMTATGMIELNAPNIALVIEALRGMRITDLE
jgi:hypothetical protein